MDIKVSVILTVHNAEDTLQECLDSAINQTLSDIEILCMDGGSTDGSPLILEENAKRDRRIRIINDPNTSYGHKINRGIDEAVGEYVAILESDDAMVPDMLEKLYSCAQRFDLDFADGNYDTICRHNNLTYRQFIPKYGDENCYDRVITVAERARLLESATGAIWTGLYKTSFMRNHNIRINESEGASFQDTSFRFFVSMYATRSYHIRDAVYLYRIDNAGSSIHDERKVFAIAREYDFLKNELGKRNVTGLEWEYYIKWKYRGYFWNSMRLDGGARQTFLEAYRRELEGDIDSGILPKLDSDNPEYTYTYLMLEDYTLFLSHLDRGYRDGINNVRHITELLKNIYGRRLVIFGCGANGRRILYGLNDSGGVVSCACDNNPSLHGTQCMGVRVYSVGDAVSLFEDHMFVIPKGKYACEMESQLIELGKDRENIYLAEC